MAKKRKLLAILAALMTGGVAVIAASSIPAAQAGWAMD
jgi:hypothetical protein